MSELEISETPQMLSDFADSISYIRLSEEPLLPEIALTFHLYVDKNENIYIKKAALSTNIIQRGIYQIALQCGARTERRSYYRLETSFTIQNNNFMLVNNYGVNFKQYSLEGTYMGDFAR